MTAEGADFGELTTREFFGALLSRVTIPALDGSSEEPAFLTVKFDPQSISYYSGGGSVSIPPDHAAAQKKWLSSNFRLEIGDLPTSRVSKIDSFSWEQKVVEDEIGAFREPTLRPAAVEVPNLKVTISMADIQPWQDWF